MSRISVKLSVIEMMYVGLEVGQIFFSVNSYMDLDFFVLSEVKLGNSSMVCKS